MSGKCGCGRKQGACECTQTAKAQRTMCGCRETYNISFKIKKPGEQCPLAKVTVQEISEQRPPVAIIDKEISKERPPVDVTGKEISKEPPLADVTDKGISKKPPPADVTDKEISKEPPPADVTDKGISKEPPPADVTDKGISKEPPPADVTDKGISKEPPPADVTDKEISKLLEESETKPDKTEEGEAATEQPAEGAETAPAGGEPEEQPSAYERETEPTGEGGGEPAEEGGAEAAEPAEGEAEAAAEEGGAEAATEQPAEGGAEAAAEEGGAEAAAEPPAEGGAEAAAEEGGAEAAAEPPAEGGGAEAAEESAPTEEAAPPGDQEAPPAEDAQETQPPAEDEEDPNADQGRTPSITTLNTARAITSLYFVGLLLLLGKEIAYIHGAGVALGIQGHDGHGSHLPPSNPDPISPKLPNVFQTFSEDTMVDAAVLEKLESGFAKLASSDSKSLLKKYLTKEVFDNLKTKKTPSFGSTLLDVIQSGFANHDSGVGIYAPDAEAYNVFADLFDPIIEDYHGGFKKTDKHPPKDWGDVDTLGNLDPAGEYIISTRVRCGRSMQGYPFNPCLTEAQYKEMEEKVSSTLSGLEGELKGQFYPLTGMTKEVQQKLIDDHFLFKEGDRFLQAANACRFWPTGRGIYHNDAKTFLVWCNEEDHLRIISMQMGGDLGQVYRRLVSAVNDIEKRIPFSHDDRLGFLTFCPTNLGTTVRASVHIKVPKLAADKAKLEEVAGKYNLQVRGTRGEHTEAEGGVYDISNKRRMGLTEYDAVKEMNDGIAELIKLESSL